MADGDVTDRGIIARTLGAFHHKVTAVCSGKKVIETVTDEFDVIILAINLPEMDGFETAEILKKLEHEIPVIFLTKDASAENAIRAVGLGAYDFLIKPVQDFDAFHTKIKGAAQKRRHILKERAYREYLEEEIVHKTRELEEKNRLLHAYGDGLESATVKMMSSLQNAMKEKDCYTAGHTVRVTEYAVMLGRAMGLPHRDILALGRAAQFHDVGKLVIDLSCIQKPGKLSITEWDLIRKHPVVGANIVRPLGFMEREAFIIRHHHERLDGSGYPDGLTGKYLDLLTRILMVVDSYDAMTSRRNYRVNLNMEQALSELYGISGSQFDSEVVECFAKNIVNFSPDKNVFFRETPAYNM
ncbi:MAG: cyclic di-GMP phosphodiesterase response regulator [Deltaproteobacteria bacterium]|nr:MAG: cyclic di-GMP phosphodiesterase response regulator [Deltaproteobacteria bacterium]